MTDELPVRPGRDPGPEADPPEPGEPARESVVDADGGPEWAHGAPPMVIDD